MFNASYQQPPLNGFDRNKRLQTSSLSNTINCIVKSKLHCHEGPPKINGLKISLQIDKLYRHLCFVKKFNVRHTTVQTVYVHILMWRG